MYRQIEDFEAIAETMAKGFIAIDHGKYTHKEKFPARRGLYEAVALFDAAFSDEFPDAPHTFTNMVNNARVNARHYGLAIVCFHEDIMDLTGGPKCNKCGTWTDRIKDLPLKGEQFPFAR